ncbi:FAS1 domain-containing protein, partial [Auricularia subglabra TFB-10046 SS5]
VCPLTRANDHLLVDSARPEVLSNADLLTQIISYHVAHGSFGNTSAFAKSPAHTILPTLLSNDTIVQLEGGRAQVLVATVENDKIELLNQNGTVSVTNATTPAFGNFHILPIDGILTPPATLADVAQANNLSTVLEAVQQAGLTETLTGAKGITVFAPTNEALATALAALGNVTDRSLIATVLQNHVINGTTVYSTQLSKDYTSAAGQPLKFTVDGGTVTVHSGDDSSKISAKIVRSDVLAENGVIHVIDAVLANTNRDDGAASSAYESATSAASSAATQTPTGGIGSDGGSGGNGSGNGDNAAARLTAGWSVLVATAVVGVVMGAFSL